MSTSVDSQGKQPVKYASPTQRLWAWVGVVYMVILVLLTTYALAHASYLRGIGPAMLAPALGGVGGMALLRHRETGRGKLLSRTIAGACWAAAAWGVISSIPNLLAQL